MSEQLALTDPTWPCATCDGTGKVTIDDLEIGLLTERRCPTCLGARVVEFDPEDKTQIPW
jgi:DnaJ-class molecular chaperone